MKNFDFSSRANLRKTGFWGSCKCWAALPAKGTETLKSLVSFLWYCFQFLFPTQGGPPRKDKPQTRHGQLKRDHLERITYQQIPKAYRKHNKLTIQHKSVGKVKKTNSEFSFLYYAVLVFCTCRFISPQTPVFPTVIFQCGRFFKYSSKQRNTFHLTAAYLHSNIRWITFLQDVEGNVFFSFFTGTEQVWYHIETQGHSWSASEWFLNSGL